MCGSAPVTHPQMGCSTSEMTPRPVGHSNRRCGQSDIQTIKGRQCGTGAGESDVLILLYLSVYVVVEESDCSVNYCVICRPVGWASKRGSQPLYWL